LKLGNFESKKIGKVEVGKFESNQVGKVWTWEVWIPKKLGRLMNLTKDGTKRKDGHWMKLGEIDG
jgi:hypothetical protein